MEKMTEEEFIGRIDEAIDLVITNTGNHKPPSVYSCSIAHSQVSEAAASYYSVLFSPKFWECDYTDNWLNRHYHFPISEEELLPMRLTMMLLFKEYCLEHKTYKEF